MNIQYFKDFFWKYCVRIYSLPLLVLVCYEIYVAASINFLNTYLIVNIICNCLMTIIGFLFPLNPFHMWSIDRENFGNGIITIVLIKMIAFTILNSIGIARIKHNSSILFNVFVVELITNGIVPFFCILVLTFIGVARYFKYLFFPENTVENDTIKFTDIKDTVKWFNKYWGRLFGFWCYLLCGYEIFVVFMCQENLNYVMFTIFILILNFILGTGFIILPLNPLAGEGSLIGVLIFLKIVLYIVPGIPFAFVSKINKYTLSVLILEYGLHVGLPIGLTLVGCTFILFKLMCATIISPRNLADDLQQNQNLQNIPEQPIANINETTIIKPQPNKYVVVNKYEDNICSICLDEIDKSTQYAMLPCSHILHKQCADSWLPNHSGCPVCKKIVESV